MANNEEVLLHLREGQKGINASINLVNEVTRNGSKYKVAEFDTLLGELESLNSGCAVCAAWDGKGPS